MHTRFPGKLTTSRKKPTCVALCCLVAAFSVPEAALAQKRAAPGGPASTKQYATINHQLPTATGRLPRGSSDAGTITAVSIVAVLAGLGTYELATHHGSNGPDIPKAFDMNEFAIKGLARANWPIVLDFLTDSPGVVQIDVKSKEYEHRFSIYSRAAGTRTYQIVYLPADFDSQPQSAIYQVSFTPAGGSATSSGLRAYAIGAGFKAVGSVSIDNLSFQPATVHPRLKEVANYQFHAHSSFDGVLADFVVVSLGNGHIDVKQDASVKLPAVDEGQLASETWDVKQGKAGEHMLQIKAWRGLENGGDWVVAWSPDYVEIVK